MSLLATGSAAQEYVYVTTDNLLLRNKPTVPYTVYAVLHAPTRLRILPYKKGFDHKEVKDRFYEVRIAFTNADGLSQSYDGFVDRRFVASTPPPGPQLNVTCVLPVLRPTDDPSFYTNDHWFPYPRYKGGDTPAKAPQRRYLKGPHGGCYYLSPSGRKVYVDKSFCH